MEYFGVTGLTISHANGSPVTGGSFTITNSPSLNVKADGKSVYSGKLSFSFSGGAIAPNIQQITGAGDIMPKAVFCSVDSKKVIRKGDIGIANCTGKDVSSGVPVDVPVPVNVEITDANQSVVKGA